MLPFSMDEVLDLIRKLLTAFKKVMAWLGILVLPEEGDYDNYPPSPNHEAVEGE